MVVQAIIFDFGGVLVRTEDRKPRTVLAERLGLTYDELSALIFDSPSAIQAMRGEISALEHWDEVRKSLDLDAEGVEWVSTEFWAGDALDENLVNVLRSLRPRYTTVLLSNAWDDLRPVIEEEWKIDDAFDRLVISAEIGMVKPDLQIYQWVIAELGVDASQAVFVDDFIQNIEGANAAGMKTIHSQSPGQALQELRSLLE